MSGPLTFEQDGETYRLMKVGAYERSWPAIPDDLRAAGWVPAGEMHIGLLSELERVQEQLAKVREWAETNGGPKKPYDAYIEGKQDGANAVLDILDGDTHE